MSDTLRSMDRRARIRRLAAYAGGGGGSPAFTPASLFAAGEVGAWYDPSDLSTLFRDTAGTLPVTAPGDTVALMLDKSRGLTLGSELVSNGDFSSEDLSPWTATSATASVSSGRLNLTATAGFGGIRRSLSSATVAGRWYVVEATLVSGTGRFTIEDGVGSDPSTPNINYTGPTTIRAVVARDNPSVFDILLRTATAGQTTVWDNISVRELPGNHATQAILAARPTYRVDGNGRPYLEFDGTDDFLSTSAINFTATDKMTVFAGVRKLSNNTAVIAELSAVAENNIGSFNFFNKSNNQLTFFSRGTAGAEANDAITSSPIDAVIVGASDVAAPSVLIRRGGQQRGQSSVSQGTGNFGSHPLFIGRRGGTTLPFSGWLYGLIVRGAATDAAAIGQTEAWLAARTGVTL